MILPLRYHYAFDVNGSQHNVRAKAYLPLNDKKTLVPALDYFTTRNGEKQKITAIFADSEGQFFRETSKLKTAFILANARGNESSGFGWMSLCQAYLVEWDAQHPDAVEGAFIDEEYLSPLILDLPQAKTQRRNNLAVLEHKMGHWVYCNGKLYQQIEPPALSFRALNQGGEMSLWLRVDAKGATARTLAERQGLVHHHLDVDKILKEGLEKGLKIQRPEFDIKIHDPGLFKQNQPPHSQQKSR